MKLSIAMIVKNEEKNLDRTLEALIDLKDKLEYEIIIVDTGSTDRTMDIARKYTKRVYEHEWSGSFSKMRNISLSYCTGDWILVLDADEVLENPEELVNFFESEKSELFNSATVNIRNYDGNDKRTSSEASLVRLFRNVKEFKYSGRVHEQPTKILPRAHSNVSFLHYGYTSDDYELMNYKFERNKKLLEEELKTAKGEYKIYVLFQLSKSYSMANKKEESFRYIKMAYDLETKRKDNKMHTYVYHWYANILFNRKEYKKTVEVCNELLKFSEENLDIFYIMAISYSLLEKYQLAYKYYNKYFKLKKKRDEGEYSDDLSLSETAGIYFDKMVSNRIICYYKERKYEKVIEEFEKSEKVDKWKDIVDIYIYSCIVTNKLKKVTKFYENREIDDLCIDKLIFNIKDIDLNNYIDNINEVREVLSSLDERIKIYMDIICNNSISNMEKIDFSIYYDWKEEILEKLVLIDINNLNLIRNVSSDVVKAYISKMCNNYKCVDLMYDYSKERFLVTNILELNFVCNVENVLLFNKSIKGEKYKNLVLRSLVNRRVFKRKIFNSDILNDECFEFVLDRYDRFWVEIEKEIKLYSKGRLSYLKRMNEVLRLNDDYSSIIDIFLKEATDEAISNEMIQEKENIFTIIENFISTNKLKEARELLLELEKMFKWDGKILSYKGIINYIEGDFDAALLNLSLARILMAEEFDLLFNIACVLEKQNRVEDCREYYESAYLICTDEEMKLQIKEILQGLR